MLHQVRVPRAGGALPGRAARTTKVLEDDLVFVITARPEEKVRHLPVGEAASIFKADAGLQSSLRKLIPFGNRVLVKRFEAVAKTASGIYLPDAETKQQNEGEVVAVGPGARAPDGTLIPAQSAVGDKVLLPEYGGSSVKLGDKELFLFRDEDILGKLE
ncbi:GroES chaperonin family [Phytophthora cactorum]|nr:GroES chaperonin family [Phytophthora cactorum]